jgi:hypothetical protein
MIRRFAARSKSPLRPGEGRRAPQHSDKGYRRCGRRCAGHPAVLPRRLGENPEIGLECDEAGAVGDHVATQVCQRQERPP